MANVYIDNVRELAIIECAGRFVGSEAACKLRDAVMSQTESRVLVLDLTEMRAIGGGGLGVLVTLQRLAQDQHIRFKLFNPSQPVRDKLKHVDLEVVTLEQIMTLLSGLSREYSRALLEAHFPFHHLSKYA